MRLADAIAPGSRYIELHFPDENDSASLGTLWKEAMAVRRVRRWCGGEPIAAALSNTRACVTVLLGAIAAGQPLVSVPIPHRGADLNWYSRFVEQLCRDAGVNTLLVESDLLSQLPPMSKVRVLSYHSALAFQGSSDTEPEPFVLTQFTSGSTASPQGVVLSDDKLVANLLALVERFRPEPGDGVCTWLPLSHDMGLIGMFLWSLIGLGDDWARGGDLVIMTPRSFMRSPGRWMANCEGFGSTITGAPTFGLEVASRRRRSVGSLSRLRICAVGAEPIYASTLERFAEAFRDADFDPTAFCPSYGMAEAVLGVTATAPSAPWHAIEFDSGLPLSSGRATDGSSTRLIGCGHALRGYELRIVGSEGSSEVGEIAIRGPSIATSNANGQIITDTDGWFHTKDIGILRGEELYVIGRLDDVLCIAGRNVYPLDIETVAAEVHGIRKGRVVAVPEGDTFTLIAERDGGIRDKASVNRVAREFRQQVVRRIGVSPRRVLITRRESFPRTTSGKIRRSALIESLRDSQLEVLDGSLD